MADAVISVVAERVASIIENQISYEVNLVRSVKEELRDLSNKFQTIKNVLDDAEKRGVREKSVKNWLKKLEDTAYEMDDILDEWNYALLKQHKRKEVRCSFISSTCLCFKKLVDRRKTGKRIENVKAALNRIFKERDEFKFEVSQPAIEPLRYQSTSSIEVEKVHGVDIDRNKNDIVRKLMIDDGSHHIVCVVGMGGIGKTTLAQLVYNDSRVKDCFELRIWICVSDPFNLCGISRAIVASVTKESIPRDTDQMELILEKLRNCILGKKFLLVLDDVWTEDYSKWEPLKINLKDGAPGSKIMVTTRKESVAKMMMRGNVDIEIYRPEKLSDDECWKLLRSISLSGRSEKECGMFEDVGKKIATKCEGLPLAANVLGSLLQFKDSLEEWENVLKSEIWQLEEAEVDLFPHLILSYNELSPSLKRCFSYCAVHPKDSEIKVESLIKEWMALGYLGSVTGDGVELKGRDYFNNLAVRSLFQDVKRRNGRIVECKMHDIVHDFALFLRGNSGISEEGGADVTKRSCQVCSPLLVSRVQEYRNLAWQVDSPVTICDCLTSVRVLRFEQRGPFGPPQGMKKLIHLRWLELNGTELHKDDLEIICRLYFLQTLLLLSCSLEEIPVEIGNLVELRHLDLSFNEELKELPESVCRLVELRTLQLNHCENLHGLPEGIHELQNLQHLLMDETPASGHLPRALGELSGLRTLGTDNHAGINFYGGSGCNRLGLLKKLNNLSGSLSLEIKIISGSDLEELVEDAREAELRNKIYINSFRTLFVKNVEECSSPSSSSSLWTEAMEALEPNQKLDKLEIWRYGGSRLPQWIYSPLNLVKSIILIEFDELPSLPPLGKLPFLEFLYAMDMKELKFVGRELLGIESSSSTTTTTKEAVVAFPKLKRMIMNDHPKWSKWKDITAEEEESSIVSIMPSLEELHIESCTGLKKLPHRLLRKASSSLRILNIIHSPVLQRRYRYKDGSQCRSISQNNPKLQLSSQSTWYLLD